MADFESTRRAMQEMVRNAQPILFDEYQEALIKHEKFIHSGGSGGSWETFYINNLIFGVYKGGKGTQGEQASISFRNFTTLNMQKASLVYANLVGNFWNGMNFLNADFRGSLFIDSFFNECTFENADLQSCDFSRSEMRNCIFKDANLINTDFENCDLTGADFRGAKIDASTKFKGAILDNVLQ